LEPEFELAIKVAAYIELFWDGCIPKPESLDVIQKRISFSRLLSNTCGIRDCVLALAKEQLPMGSEAQDRLIAAIQSFLYGSEGDSIHRKPRLRRAAKVAGLWMDLSEPMAYGELASRYVAINEGAADFCLAKGRQYKYESPAVDSSGKRKSLTPKSGRESHASYSDDEQNPVLEHLTVCCSRLLADDLVALERRFGSEPIFQVARPKKSPAGSDAEQDREELEPVTLSVSSMRRDLVRGFYAKPRWRQAIARDLDYIPSFTALLVQKIADVAGIENRSRPGWIENKLYALFTRVLDPGGTLAEFKLSREVESDDPLGALEDYQLAASRVVDSVEKHVKQIGEPGERRRNKSGDQAVRQARKKKKPLSDDQRKKLKFEIGILLLGRSKAVLTLANKARIPVPFAIAFGEELKEVEQSRATRWRYGA
jgi:hypothetical protein